MVAVHTVRTFPRKTCYNWPAQHPRRALLQPNNRFPCHIGPDARGEALPVDVHSSGARRAPHGRVVSACRAWCAARRYASLHHGRTNVGTVSLDAKELQFAADGSRTIHLSHEPPADADARTNWLPAPNGQFALIVRAYVPTPALLNGSYKLPNVARK